MTNEQEPLLGYDIESGAGPSAPSNDQESWQHWLAEKLEAKRTHQIVILLIAIDAVCVLADLSYSFFSDSCPPPGETEEEPQWLTILSHISLLITTLFLIEIPLNVFAFGTGFYLSPLYSVLSFFWSCICSSCLCFSCFSNKDDTEYDSGDGSIEVIEGTDTAPSEADPKPTSKKIPYPLTLLHLFDAFVIITTFTLELFFRAPGEEREQSLAGLLILFRLWRLVKLVGGFAVGAGELNEELVTELEETRKKVGEMEERVGRLERENGELRARLGLGAGEGIGRTAEW